MSSELNEHYDKNIKAPSCLREQDSRQNSCGAQDNSRHHGIFSEVFFFSLTIKILEQYLHIYFLKINLENPQGDLKLAQCAKLLQVAVGKQHSPLWQCPWALKDGSCRSGRLGRLASHFLFVQSCQGQLHTTTGLLSSQRQKQTCRQLRNKHQFGSGH